MNWTGMPNQNHASVLKFVEARRVSVKSYLLKIYFTWGCPTFWLTNVLCFFPNAYIDIWINPYSALMVFPVKVLPCFLNIWEGKNGNKTWVFLSFRLCSLFFCLHIFVCFWGFLPSVTSVKLTGNHNTMRTHLRFTWKTCSKSVFSHLRLQHQEGYFGSRN